MTTESQETPEREIVMELRDVTAGGLRQPRVTVLEDVNWSVARGDFWAIGGLLASGKSDLLALLGGLMPPVAGSYRLFGHEMQAGFRDEMLAERMRLGMVFDGGQLFNRMTVRENIALPLLYHLGTEETEAMVEEWLSRLDLEPLADRVPASITRGLRQRVGLARALALRPEVLLLDTPLTGLDPKHVGWWLGVLDQLAAGHPWVGGQPMTLVVTCDDLRPWRARANRFAMLQNKRLLLLGGRGDIRGQTAHLAKDLLPEDFQPE